MRILQPLVIGTLLLTHWACKPKSVAPMPQEQFVEVFTEIHLAEGVMRAHGIYGDSAKAVAGLLYKRVFNQMKVDSATYFKAYEFYSADVVLFNQILEQVQIKLSEREPVSP